MKSYAILLSTLGLITTGLGQQVKESETTLRLLERELLDAPCFERALYDVMTETLDDTAWKNLDARWEKLQVADLRHGVLRGMLAEQQGDFDEALHHYESVKADGWGAYHLARFHAFLGRTQEAKEELRKVVAAAKHPWLFREAARGLGEVILLQEGVEAAEKYYAALWEKHTALDLRMTLLEPLLALRMELGLGAAWLESMKPAFDPQGVFSPAAAEIDQGVLWHWGSLLTNPQFRRRRGPVPFKVDDSVLYGDSLYAGPKDEWFSAVSQHPDCGRWEGALSLEQGFHTLTKSPRVLAESLLRHQKTDAHTLEAVLSLSANEGGEVFLQTAKTLKDQLRERPWLVMRTALAKAAKIQAVRDQLGSEVFGGVSHPAWRFISLLLRKEAGEKPEQLRADALALWQAVSPEERLQLREGVPQELLGGSRKHFLERVSDDSSKQGSWCPVFTVVWNLRGGSFVAVMRNRFAFENQKLFSLGITTRGLTLPFRQKDGRWYLGSMADIETGMQLRFVLWLLREELGLDQTHLGKPGENGEDTAARAVDVLARGNHEEICQFLIAEPQLAEIPAKWLLTLRKTIMSRHMIRSAPLGKSEVYEAATAKIADALLTQRPDWLVTALVENRPLIKAPALDAGQCDDLLMACLHPTGKQQNDVSILELQNWRKLIPTLTDAQSLQNELAEAGRRLGTKALPHALWELQWQPSLRRQVVLASSDYMSQRPARAYLQYLNETIPKLLPREDLLLFTMSFASFEPDVDEVSYRFLQLLGPELLMPQPERSAEIRAYVDRHPRMKDLLAAWDILQVELPQGELPQTFRFVHPVNQAAMLKVLADSASPDAKLTLGVLNQRYGNPQVVARLLQENNGPQGPLNMLVRLAVQQAAMVAPPAPGVLEQAQKIFAELKAPEPARALVWRMAKTQAERQIVYDWLRKEVKPELVFAVKISVMAELARTLKLTDKEIAAAEQLDLQMHEDDPYVWISRGITHAKEGEDTQAVDSFFGALRRTNFATPPTFRWEQGPPKTSWLELTVNTGRLTELAAALTDALQSNPPGSAGELVTIMMETIIPSSDTPVLGSEVKRLLDVLLERDRHTLLAIFDTLDTAANAAEKNGRTDVATLLARLALQGVWPKSVIPESFHTQVLINDVPRGVYNARLSWAADRATQYVTAEAPITALLSLALRGESVRDFSAGLTRDAAQFPEEEQLVSCALVVQARHSPLQVDGLKLMEKLDPLARMRTAWRLCLYAPAANVPLRDLAPMLAAGLKATFQTRSHQRNGVPSYQLAEKVLPWIEKAGATAELRDLVTLFAEKTNDDLWPMCWRLTAGLAARYAGTEQAGEINRRWWDHCMRAMNHRTQPVEWYIETMEETCVLVQDPHCPTPEPFADLAHELWQTIQRRFSQKEDPPAKMARLLCDALIATGRTDQLKKLEADMDRILQFEGSPVFAVVRDRIQQGLTLLGADVRGLPAPQVWLDKGDAEGAAATVAWRLSVPLKPPASDAYELFGPAADFSDEWVVPHFMKGTHELELFAGESPEALLPVAKITIKDKTGTVRVEHPPAAGWLRAVLRSTSTGATIFGSPVMYCLGKPLMDSTALATAKPPEWEDEWTELYGRPISSPLPLESGMRLLITDFTHSKSAPATVRSKDATDLGNILFVAVNKSGEPIGFLPRGRSRERRPDGTEAMLVEADMGLGPDSRLQPTHLVMTTFAEANALLQCLRLQVFAQAAHAPTGSNQPKALTAMPVANIDFPIVRWCLNEKLPRAAFVGAGVLAVYDTTTSPWKELLYYQDAELGAGTTVFTLHPDSVCVMTAQKERKDTTRELWQVRCDGTVNPVSLRECPKVTLSFAPVQSDVSPDERSLVFISAHKKGEMQVAWLDGSHSLKQLKIATTQTAAPQSSAPSVACWWDNQTAGIEQGGYLYRVRFLGAELKLERVEKSSLGAKETPQDLMSGQRSLNFTWVLKRSHLLVQMDRKTGDALGAYRLPEECIGRPMWWSTEGHPVLLQTIQRELIIVTPLDPKTAQ
jgi:tetratricopeptide (TPR) repeat protein